MGYIVQIVAVDPQDLCARFRSADPAALRADAMAMLEAQGLEDLPPDEVVDTLTRALAQAPIDAPAKTVDVGSTCLYLVIQTLQRSWSPAYSESWNGYPEALERLARDMPLWAELLQTALYRGLFGLRAEDWPACGWISPAELRDVAASFTDDKREAYLAALQCPSEAAWYAVQDDVQRCAEAGLWIVHSYG